MNDFFNYIDLSKCHMKYCLSKPVPLKAMKFILNSSNIVFHNEQYGGYVCLKTL